MTERSPLWLGDLDAAAARSACDTPAAAAAVRAQEQP
jgi:hypothetical protein